MKPVSCKSCGGCGVQTVGEAFDKLVPDFWIDLYRCEQYVICYRCSGVGLYLVSESAEPSDHDKARRMVVDGPVDKRLVEVLSALSKARLMEIMRRVGA